MKLRLANGPYRTYQVQPTMGSAVALSIDSSNPQEIVSGSPRRMSTLIMNTGVNPLYLDFMADVSAMSPSIAPGATISIPGGPPIWVIAGPGLETSVQFFAVSYRDIPTELEMEPTLMHHDGPVSLLDHLFAYIFDIGKPFKGSHQCAACRATTEGNEPVGAIRE